MAVEGKEEEMVTPGDVLGKAADLRPGKGAYELNGLVYASLTGLPRTLSRSAESPDQVNLPTPCVRFFIFKL